MTFNHVSSDTCNITSHSAAFDNENSQLKAVSLVHLGLAYLNVNRTSLECL